MNADAIYHQTRADHGMPRACLLCHQPARDFDGYCGDDHAELGQFGDELTAILRDLMGWHQ